MVGWRVIEVATIAVLALSLWCLAGDAPGGAPIGEEEAVAGAFRHLVTSVDQKSQKPLAACVTVRFAAGGDVPPDFLADVMAAHPDLEWSSGCRWDPRGLYHLGVAGRRVPSVSCEASPWPPMSRNLVKVACSVHWGPLNGMRIGFDVSRSPIGVLDVRDAGVIGLE
jgi:hypothetical protein